MFLACCSSEEQHRAGWDQTGVGMRMARHPEGRKVTKHTFPPNPARHTHAHAHTHTHTHTHCTHKHRPTLQSCVCQMRVWYMTAVTASLIACLWRLCNALCYALARQSSQYSLLEIQWNSTWSPKQCHLHCTEGKWWCLIKYWQSLKSPFARKMPHLCEHETSKQLTKEGSQSRANIPTVDLIV